MNSDLYRLIGEGEHRQQDFKYFINNSKKIALSLVAFANTEGGRLLVGVKDNAKVAGISSDEEYYMVESAAKIYSKPPITFTTRQWQAEGKTVLGITVAEGENKPYFARDENGKWLAYVRINDENVLAHNIQLIVWKKQKSLLGIRFTYSEAEKFLIDFLQENENISLSKFIRRAHISRKKAEEVLSNFVVMEVVMMIASREGTLFILNEAFDKSEFEKFR